MDAQINTASSIQDLQKMLNQLSQRYPQLPGLAVTGVFDESTLEAVMTFQRDFGLPVTGRVDYDSWHAITRAYREDLLHYGPPAPLQVLPHGEFTTGAGQSSQPLGIAQAMLCALAQVLTNFNPCQMDQLNQGDTLSNLQAVQRLAGLPETGALNRATWEYLTRLYHLYVVRDALDVFFP